MDNINYDLIISYLAKKNLITPKYKYCNNLKFKIFDIYNNFYRYGITAIDDNDNNISFYSSIITLIENYNISLDNNEISLIDKFKNELINNYNKSLLSNNIKQLEKPDIREHLKIDPSYIILQYIVDILNINIIVFKYINNENCLDKELFKIDDNIYVLYNNSFLDFNKNTLLFIKYNNYWEPIIEKNDNSIKKIFNINDNIIKNILENKNLIKYYDLKQEIFFEDNIKYDKANLNKLKIADLKLIINKLQIDLNSIKKQTKAILIDLIIINKH